MKRRNFIGALAAAIGISTAVFGKNAEAPKIETDHAQIFREMFFKLNGFPPNSLQMIMFDEYQTSCKWLCRPRQIGMTTFMHALVAYETKVNKKNICIIANNDTWARRYYDFREAMTEKLGKSIHDGKVRFYTSVEATRGASVDLIFQENARIHHIDEFRWPIPVINFTTYETQDYTLLGYKGKEIWYSPIINCPYIPLITQHTI